VIFEGVRATGCSVIQPVECAQLLVGLGRPRQSDKGTQKNGLLPLASSLDGHKTSRPSLRVTTTISIPRSPQQELDDGPHLT
jgi:hypothetical protein